MSFEWLDGTPPRKNGAKLRSAVATAELADRAGTLFRLGFTQAAATARLTARVAWEYDPPSSRGPHRRPDALSDAAIAKLVAETYARAGSARTRSIASAGEAGARRPGGE